MPVGFNEEVFEFIERSRHKGVYADEVISEFSMYVEGRKRKSSSVGSHLSALKSTERIYKWIDESGDEIWFATEYGPQAKVELSVQAIQKALQSLKEKGGNLDEIRRLFDIDSRNKDAIQMLKGRLRYIVEYGGGATFDEVSQRWYAYGFGPQESEVEEDEPQPKVFQALQKVAPNEPRDPFRLTVIRETHFKDVTSISVQMNQGGPWVPLFYNRVYIRPKGHSLSSNGSSSHVYIPYAYKITTRTKRTGIEQFYEEVVDGNFELVFDYEEDTTKG